MGEPIRKTHFSYAQYLAMTELDNDKYEYYRGEIYAMAGGTANHSMVSGNTLAELRSKIKEKGCIVFTNDLLIRVETNDAAFYPDVSAVCGEPEFDPHNPNAIVNPIVIAEVLSPSTESWDRNRKRLAYQQLDSLKEFLLISQKEPEVERHTRLQGNEWTYATFSDLQGHVTLPNLNVKLSMAEIYFGTKF